MDLDQLREGYLLEDFCFVEMCNKIRRYGLKILTFEFITEKIHLSKKPRVHLLIIFGFASKSRVAENVYAGLNCVSQWLAIKEQHNILFASWFCPRNRPSCYVRIGFSEKKIKIIVFNTFKGFLIQLSLSVYDFRFSKYESVEGLLGCCALQYFGCEPVFQENVLPPSALKMSKHVPLKC